jgi:16S rRNA (guanine1207-N2)-methyltransferase
MEDPLPDVEDALARGRLDVTTWHRRAHGGRKATSWPPSGPFDLATLRLPRSKGELVMSLHAAASVLRPEGRVLVYGANDEGIQAALGSLEELFADVRTVAIGGRCRVLEAEHPRGTVGWKGSLADWRCDAPLGYPGLPSTWASYPGVFAHGRVDDGTRLLLDALPSLPSGARILDYGCGSGVVAWVARNKAEEVVVEMLDVDAVALEAARENVPGAVVHLGDGLPPVGAGPYDAVFSNPPFHRGKAEEPEMIRSLIRGSPALLHPRGMLVFVAQTRLRFEDALREHFREVKVLAADSTFRVWKGGKPRKERRKAR